MKETKRRVEFFSLYDHTNIEKHLEKMASKGWMIESIGSTLWKYKKTEPQKIRFSVVYYPKKVSEGTIISADRQNFIEICSSGGWNYVTNMLQLHIFCTKDENVTPIETDPEIQIECIHKFAKTEILNNYLLLIAICVAITSYGIYRFWTEPVNSIGDSGFGFFGAVPLLLFFSVYNIISYLIWHKKAKAAAENSEFTDTKRLIKIEVLFWLPAFLVFCGIRFLFFLRLRYVLFIFGLVAAGILFYKLYGIIKNSIDKSKYSGKKNLKTASGIILVLVFIGAGIFSYLSVPKPYYELKIDTPNIKTINRIYNDPGAPLDISEFTDIEDKTVSREKNVDEALLIKQTKWNIYSVNEKEYNKIEYKITDVRFSPLIERCKNELIFDHFLFDYEKLDTDSEYEIYRIDDRPSDLSPRFVIACGNRIVELHMFRDMTEEELLLAAEKLFKTDK